MGTLLGMKSDVGARGPTVAPAPSADEADLLAH